MHKFGKALLRKGLTPLLLTGSLIGTPMVSNAQRHDNQGNFYNGAYQGGRGGSYNRGNDYRRGDRGYQGSGIGTGRGALIGGAGGAALGALFGGGLKGALIGGGAGAGIGAIAGHVHQNNKKRDYYEGRNGYRPR